MSCICPKNTFLQLKHIQRIYLTLLSTTLKVHQFSYVIFEIIGHFLRHNSSLFFLAQTLHNFDKNVPAKCKFSDFSLLELKFTKFLMSFFKQKVIFFQSWIILQCHERSLFCTFLAANLYAIDKSGTSKCKFSHLSLLALKFTKFFMSF